MLPFFYALLFFHDSETAGKFLNENKCKEIFLIMGWILKKDKVIPVTGPRGP
jgi:hypothetical protein